MQRRGFLTTLGQVAALLGLAPFLPLASQPRDDSAYLQALIDAALRTGSCIVLPPGEYQLTRSLAVTLGSHDVVNLLGHGAVLHGQGLPPECAAIEFRWGVHG